jgi:signal transduction histidine kinase
VSKPGWSLRQYLLILLLGVTLVPLGMASIISVWQYSTDIDRIERASMKQEMGVARLAERYMLYALDNTRRALRTLSKTALTNPAGLRGRVAEEVHGNPQIEAIHITDRDGKILLSSREGEGLPIDDQESFRAAMAAGGETVYTNYFYSRLVDTPVVALLLPYYDRNDKIQGIIRSSLSLEFLLNEFTNQYNFEERYYIFFVDRRGTLLAAQNFRPGRNLKTLPPVEKLLNGEDGTLKYISNFFGDRVDGIERLGAFRHIGDAKWGVVVSQPSAHVLANPIRNLHNFLLFIMFTAVACFAVSYLVANRLTRPLDALAAEMSSRTARQDFSTASEVTVASGVREFQLLTTAYNTLMGQVRQYFETVGTLNTEVSEQNARLQDQNVEISKQAEKIQSQLQELDMLYQRVNEANVSLETQVAERTSEVQSAYRRLADKAAELEEANGKLTELVGELRKLDQLQADFLANVSHELRTPITFITAYGSSLEDGLLGGLSDGQQEAIRCIMEGASRLTVLVEDLLDLNRLESGALEIMPGPIDPASLIGPVVESAKALAHAQKQEISIDIERGVPAIFADYDRTQQVLRNLLSNAIKFTPERGSIKVRCYAAGDGVAIEVVDNGIGIGKESIPRLFDRFYQVDTSSTRKYAGTGIGLNIVKSLLDLMGGRIEVESEVGKGSTFRFILPASRDLPTSAGATHTYAPPGDSRTNDRPAAKKRQPAAVAMPATAPMRHPDILDDDAISPPSAQDADEELIG